MTPRRGRVRREELGRYKGRKTRYHKKYCEVQTLLKVTKASVCASIVADRSLRAIASGMRRVERTSWGRKARDSKEVGRWVVAVWLAEER